ncbi:dihydrofolate reductase family protein [Nocardia altamirensis]|uniref:dihydrofolate reductase family protein n=1 Tax=Nocardia altamirensis TaxID=472158 RepID=UPI00083FDAE2|nr:dihydrofolate reductase family protein [Nocardia altamirensis]
MRELIVSEFITIDGVVEAPGGEPGHRHSGWVFDYAAPPIENYKLDELNGVEAMLFGRSNYEQFAQAWTPRTGTIADRLNTMPKYVVGTKVEQPPAWSNTTALGGELVSAVTTLKAGDGGPILVHGSATLVQGLLTADLVDELRLQLFPVVVGGGRSIFPTGFQKTTFALTSVVRILPEVIALHYRRQAIAAAGPPQGH